MRGFRRDGDFRRARDANHRRDRQSRGARGCVSNPARRAHALRAHGHRVGTRDRAVRRCVGAGRGVCVGGDETTPRRRRLRARRSRRRAARVVSRRPARAHALRGTRAQGSKRRAEGAGRRRLAIIAKHQNAPRVAHETHPVRRASGGEGRLRAVALSRGVARTEPVVTDRRGGPSSRELPRHEPRRRSRERSRDRRRTRTTTRRSTTRRRTIRHRTARHLPARIPVRSRRHRTRRRPLEACTNRGPKPRARLAPTRPSSSSAT